MDLLAFGLVFVLGPASVWLTFLGVRRAMKPRTADHAMHSDRTLLRRDLLGLAVTALAFAYWHGVHLDALALLERAANAVIVTALAGLVATVAATVVLVALAGGDRRRTLRSCGAVFAALAPFAFFIVSYVVLGDAAIGGGDSSWSLLLSIVAALVWLTLMPTTFYYAFRYKFRIGDAPEALLPMVVAGTAVVALVRSGLRVADQGFVAGFPVWVGALLAFLGPLSVLVIVVRMDLLPMWRSGGVRGASVAGPQVRTAD